MTAVPSEPQTQSSGLRAEVIVAVERRDLLAVQARPRSVSDWASDVRFGSSATT